MTTWVAVLAGTAVLLAWPPVPVPRAPTPTATGPTATGPVAGDGVDKVPRTRLLLCLMAGVGAALFVGGPGGPAAGVVAAVAAWVVLGRSEPAAVRREREAVQHELPHVVTLLAAALRAGVAPAEAARLVCRALPGPATRRLERTVAHLELGADPGQVWDRLAHEPGLAPLGRALARSQATGASVVAAVDRLSDELAREARGQVEDRARAVGVKAAVPLGLCLLPAFVLIGIVPLVAGLLTTLAW
ncbi:MAG: type II secretion system F family protein [Nocardioides sp.]